MADQSASPIYNSPRDQIDVQLPGGAIEGERPHTVRAVSSPTYQSPLRHRRPQRPRTREVKTTLNAKSEYSNSEDDGTAQHRINQYLVKQEIGRGSFGAVHLAVDQYDHEYAVKEFSKSRLRKRAQSNLLRSPNAKRRLAHLHANLGFNSPLHRHSSDDEDNAFDLIKEEIAIMKKLHHPNIVSLIEVLDDPTEDSLYMVMEMCKRGVVMKVGLEETADPYNEEQCRHWFRDLVLGIEYLHAQGIIHRDIKPDNCLITDENVLKVVDFGVSEMFEKESEMSTAKSAGSPAFMPPELCVAKHGTVSGRACDIWSMGVTLYCLRHGKIPFERTNILDLYEAISKENLYVVDDCSESLNDLLSRLLEKDPDMRIKMEELREHPWLSKNGEDPMPSKEENVLEQIEPPTEEELNAAITGNMRHLMVVVKAVKRFKALLIRKRPDLLEGFFGRASRIVQPPLSMARSTRSKDTRSVDADNRRPIEGALTVEGVHRDIPTPDPHQQYPPPEQGGVISGEAGASSPLNLTPVTPSSRSGTPTAATTHASRFAEHESSRSSSKHRSRSRHEGKGQAHDPLQDYLYLNIGSGMDPHDDSQEQPNAMNGGDSHMVSESPSAVDVNVYEKAYEEEIQKILAARTSATLYLTRRVQDSKRLRTSYDNLVDYEAVRPRRGLGFAQLVASARDETTPHESPAAADIAAAALAKRNEHAA